MFTIINIVKRHSNRFLAGSATVLVVSYVMGNICGKESKTPDPFAQPGRTLGSAPPAQASPRAAVPKISGQGHTLGGKSGNEPDDARRAAARAAEVSFRRWLLGLS